MPAAASSAARQLAMGRRRRMDDDRVDAAQRGGPLGDPQGVDEGRGGRRAAGQLHGQHPAARGQEAGGDGVVGVRGEHRVQDARDPRRGFQERGEAGGGRRVALHPQGQRRDAAQDQEGRERREGAARVHVERPHGGDPLARSRRRRPARTSEWPERYLVADSTTRSAPRASGPAQGRRGERVVDDDGRAVAVAQLREGRQVGDGDGRVGDRLEVEDAGRRRGEGRVDGARDRPGRRRRSRRRGAQARG